MRLLLIAMFIWLGLFSSFVGSDVAQAGQGYEPTIFIQLDIREQGAFQPIGDPDLIPTWVTDYILDVHSALILEGESPQIIMNYAISLGDSIDALVATINDYPEIFEAPPYRAISISVELWEDFETIKFSPFAPFPFEPLPIGLFGWVSTLVIRDGIVPDFAFDFAMGIAFYVLEECETTVQYLAQVRENAVFTDQDLFIYSAPRFYEANCRYSLGEADTALRLFEESLAFELGDPRSTSDESWVTTDLLWFIDTITINLSTIYVERGLIDEALAILTPYADLDLAAFPIIEREFERFFARADLYLALNKSAEALAEITRLIEYLEPRAQVPEQSLAWLYTERGKRYELVGDVESALADYEYAIELARYYPVVYYWRGVLIGGDSGQQDLRQFLDLTSRVQLSLYHPYIDDLLADARSRLE